MSEKWRQTSRQTKTPKATAQVGNKREEGTLFKSTVDQTEYDRSLNSIE